MGKFGMGELIVILLIVVLLFGARKLPQLGAGIGGFVKGLRKGAEDHPALPPERSQESQGRG